jgi:hypothetical protein
LSRDLCVWTDLDGQRNYFIRGVLEIPVLETGECFKYGVWSSLSAESFTRVFELWDDPRRTKEPAYFGWLSNSLPGYPETLGLPADVITGTLELRPTIVLHEGHHPLIREQREGISTERVRELAELGFHTN